MTPADVGTVGTRAVPTPSAPELAERLPSRLTLAFDPDADALLSADPLALVIGMLLDQQMPMERAFYGAYKLATRLSTDRLAAHDIAEADPEEFETLCATPPAVHRFPRAMAGRIQALCAHVVAHWDGDVTRLWDSAGTGLELRRRLEALPGFGPAKAKIFLALLAKQRGVAPPGWETASAPYGEAGFRSVADVVDRDSLVRVRQTKQAAKAAARADAQPSGQSADEPFGQPAEEFHGQRFDLGTGQLSDQPNPA